MVRWPGGWLGVLERVASWVHGGGLLALVERGFWLKTIKQAKQALVHACEAAHCISGFWSPLLPIFTPFTLSWSTRLFRIREREQHKLVRQRVCRLTTTMLCTHLPDDAILPKVVRLGEGPGSCLVLFAVLLAPLLVPAGTVGRAGAGARTVGKCVGRQTGSARYWQGPMAGPMTWFSVRAGV